MPDTTKIEWTDYTVNFWEGCQKVGPGCDNCYAEARDVRFTGGSHWGVGAPRRKVKGGISKLQKINRDANAFKAANGHWPRVFCSSLASEQPSSGIRRKPGNRLLVILRRAYV